MQATNANAHLPPAPTPGQLGGAAHASLRWKASIVVLKIVGLGAVYLCWQAAAEWAAPLVPAIAVMWGGVALVPGLSLLWRRMLDCHPTAERAALLNFPLHYLLLTILGCALIVGWGQAQAHPLVQIDFPRAVSEPLLKIFLVLALLAVLNLAVRGLGLPFAAILSRKLATGWMYARSRNPMLFLTLLALVDGGLWLQSLHALLWVLLWFSPALILYVRIYEERELEVRFGEAYVRYRERTPFFI